MTSKDGAAREIPAGRLASFEDTPEAPPQLSLPPRRPRAAATKKPAPDVERADSVDDTDADQSASNVPATVRPSRSDDSEPTRPKRGDRPAARGALKASNVHIPAALVPALEETKRTTRLSNGDIIITALEKTYEELQIKIRPRPTAGGSLFGQRVSRPQRARVSEPVTPLNYRMTSEDYAVLDRLVSDLGASSRSHLISVALSCYYKHQPPS